MNSDGPSSGADLDCRLFIRKLEEWASGRNESFYNIKAVRMTGGEPLLCLDGVLEIARSCSRLGIRPGINTNGTLLDASVARLLKEAGISTIKISLDASEEATHRRIRGSSYSLDRILEGIKAAVEFGFKVVLRFTFSRHNRRKLTWPLVSWPILSPDRHHWLKFSAGRQKKPADLNTGYAAASIKYTSQQSCRQLYAIMCRGPSQ